MARSHHRKKHKQHLRNYQHSNDLSVRTGKTRVMGLFLLLGAGLGFAIGYFASGSVIAYAIGTIAGATIGYLVGKKIDEGA